jgi:hypothetical protein
MRAGSGAAHVLLGFRNENGRTEMRLCRRIERATAGAPATAPAVIGWLAEVHEPPVMLPSGTAIALPPGMSAAEFPGRAVVKVATMEQAVRKKRLREIPKNRQVWLTFRVTCPQWWSTRNRARAFRFCSRALAA